MKKRADKNEAAGVSRRDFVSLSVVATVGAITASPNAKQLAVVETNVDVQTPDGVCDAVLFHPEKGSHPGVLIWPD